MASSADQLVRRASVIGRHLDRCSSASTATLERSPCLQYSPPELSEKVRFDVGEMRRLMDGHHVEDRDWLFRVMEESNLFCSRNRGGKVFVSPDYNQSMEQQREVNMKRIMYLLSRGVFEGWVSQGGAEAEMRRFALVECLAIYDHSMLIKLGAHFFLWGGALQLLGTKRHHDKWLKDTEDYVIKGCFAMTELGHGSNVRGIETVATYDTNQGVFVINTPCESAQKYWIGAANHATHTIIFSQLHINGMNQGVHAFVAQIRDNDGNICPNIRIADCGHKSGLNGMDNGRIWFDNLRLPRENLLNTVADVLPDGKYVSAIKNKDKRFAALLDSLTIGRVYIVVTSIYISKIGIAVAIRYSLTRRAFSLSSGSPEFPLLDYPSHQRRLLPLLAKTTPEVNKSIHIYSSAFKAASSWHNMRTLQECREACGGQGLKTENRIGILKGEYDVHSTFEGDNNILMQQVSKGLLAEYLAAHKTKKPYQGLGLEHMNNPSPVIPANVATSALRSSEFQSNLFCLRERDLLNRLAKEISQYQAWGESKEYAIILSYQLAEELGRAFSERTILQIFVEAEMTVLDGPLKDVLALLRSMYALISVEEDTSFLRYGHLSPSNAAAVRNELTKLCSELRPHALFLVNSFGIPDAFLTPIAFDYIEANSWSAVKL